MSERNKEIVNQINQALLNRGVEGLLDFCTDDVEWAMVGEKPWKGKSGIREAMASMGDDKPPAFTIDYTLADGDYVIARGHMKMTDKNGTESPYAFCDIYQMKGEKVVKLETFMVKTAEKSDKANG